jgi:cell division protein FtsL
MPAPQQERYARNALPTQPYPPSRSAPRSVPGGAGGRASRRRTFLLVVVVPVLLMLGSVYAHTVAAGLEERTARLEEQVSRAEAEKERMEVRVTELSSPGRIRSLAEERLGMRDPGAEDLKVYGRDGEDVREHEGEEAEEGSR